MMMMMRAVTAATTKEESPTMITFGSIQVDNRDGDTNGSPTCSQVARKIAIEFPLAFRFSRKQSVRNSTVSKFVRAEFMSEGCERPLYYTCDRVMYKGETWLAVTYSLFYELNPGYTFCFGACNMGWHEADVERVVVLFDEKKREPGWVYFGAHGKGQGVWRAWEECVREDEDGKTLSVFVSPSSHACYPEARRYWRVFGFANDVCSGDGEVWKPDALARCNARKQVWSIEPYQVRRGINSPAHITHPTERSLSQWERIFLALPRVRDRVKEGEPLPVVEKLCMGDSVLQE